MILQQYRLGTITEGASQGKRKLLKIRVQDKLAKIDKEMHLINDTVEKTHGTF
jgi:hypothetical protein